MGSFTFTANPHINHLSKRELGNTMDRHQETKDSMDTVREIAEDLIEIYFFPCTR